MEKMQNDIQKLIQAFENFKTKPINQLTTEEWEILEKLQKIKEVLMH